MGSKKDSINKIGNVMLLLTPVLSLALLVFSRVITVGVQGLAPGFWLDMLVNTIAMLLAFVPLYQWGVNRFKQSERACELRRQFNEMFTKVRNNKGLKALREYSRYEVQIRKAGYVFNLLQHADIDIAEYEKKYRALSKKQLYRAEELQPYQKKILCKLKRNLKFYPVDVDKIYSEKAVTVKRRLGKTVEQQQAQDVAYKLVNSLAFGAVAAMLVFQAIQDVDVLAVIVNTIIRLLMLFYNCGMAVVSARNNVENIYCGRITAETIFLSEFLEYDSRHPGWENRTESQNEAAMVE